MVHSVKQRAWGTAAEIAATVIASREIVVNADDSSLHVGDGASLGGTKLARVLDLPDDNFTLGSTNILLGGTTTTVAGLTLSGGTLSGATTLPGSGQITAAGELGLETTPLALLHVGGTYTTANPNVVLVDGTVSSSDTGTQIGCRINLLVTPTGASLSSFQGFGASLTLKSTALSVANFVANQALLIQDATYSGIVTNGIVYNATSPAINGGAVTNIIQFRAVTLTTNDGVTSGTKTNRQFHAIGITAGSAGGTLNNRCMEITIPSGGASSGTTNNRGIYITGNGGTAAGGTVNNFAILSDSQAASRIEGGLGVGVVTRNATTATFPYFYIPVCAGTPTGVPRSAVVGQAAMVFDDTAHKLWIYEQSTATWKGVVVA